jgi:hypothetical protein
MHTNTEYDTTNPAEAEAQALRDIQNWFGDSWPKVNAAMKTAVREDNLTFEQFKFLASLAGAQGYPVKVWYDKLKREQANGPA